jgi:geranylgeranyl diphosphate synthase type I
MMLLVVASCGGQWLRAISPAAALELVHNFSLVHDDIEDNSDSRRGRTTAWRKYGVPMAINMGDALFAIADQAVLDASSHYAADVVLASAASLHAACIALTRGQYLDMSYEKRTDLKVDDYWPMVEGKTAALLAASAEMGAILGGALGDRVGYFAGFGHNVGLAFQVQDDILGIWGDERATGKSVATDLVEGKNSLPVLCGLAHSTKFAERWAEGPIRPDETPVLSQLLKDEGALAYCVKEAERLTGLAMESLKAADPQGEAGEALRELADTLLRRRA